MLDLCLTVCNTMLYARKVSYIHIGVFARYEYKEHPNKVSSVLFYIASIIIHGKNEEQGLRGLSLTKF